MFNFLNRAGAVRIRLFLLVESCLIYGAFFLSVLIRFHMDFDMMVQYEHLVWKAVLILGVVQLSLYYHDLNYSNVGRFTGNLFLKLTQATAVSFFVLSIIFYVFPFSEVGRGILLIEMGLVLMIVSALRVVFLRESRSEGFGVRTLIIGTGRLARQIGQTLHQQPERGFKVVGFIDEETKNIGKTIVNPKVIGTHEDLLQIIRRDRIQAVISALPEQRGRLPVDALLHSRLMGVKVNDGTSFYERLKGKISLDELKPSWVIFSDGFHTPKATVVSKRCLDVFLSAIGLTLTLPLMVIIAFAIRLESPGPVVYRQKRVGERERIFTLHKFRSMKMDAESDSGPIWAREGDDRVTGVGRFLRKYRLDELPQLVNVLRGDMSIVGPRPERPAFVDELVKENSYYTLRHAVKPGVTGWAQVMYRYGSNSKEAMEKLQYDLYYIKNLSIVFDLYIIFETIKTVLSGNGAR
jgi:sugar transferase (PEP-CTERM system associated)